MQGLAADTTYFFRTESLWNPGTTVYNTTLISTSTYAAYPVAAAFTSASARRPSRPTGPIPATPVGTLYDLEVSYLERLQPGPSPTQRPTTSRSSLGGLAPNTSYFFQVASIDNSGALTPFAVLGGTHSTLAVAPGPGRLHLHRRPGHGADAQLVVGNGADGLQLRPAPFMSRRSPLILPSSWASTPRQR